MKERNLKIKFRNYIWIFPFIGGFLCVFSILFPAGYSDVLYYLTKERIINFWMWGFWSSDLPLSVLTPTPYKLAKSVFISPTFLIFGITCSSIIAIIGVFIMIEAHKMRNIQSYLEKKNTFLLICGCLLLLTTIIWLVEISFLNYYELLSDLLFWDDLGSPPSPDLFKAFFWSYFKMDFGVIGPLIIGVFSIMFQFLIKR
jgi:hypothetical protein